MSFWLDEAGRSPSYWSPPAYPVAEPAEPAPEQHEPALLYAPVQRERADPIPWRAALAACGAALVIHLILLNLFALSGSGPLPRPVAPATTSAMFASLVPASSISMAPSADTPQPPSNIETASDVTPPATVAPQPTPPQQTQASSPAQSAQIAEATLNTSRSQTTAIAAFHTDSDNPWAHASLPAPVLTPEQKLWAAIKPCLQGALVDQVVVDLSLDAEGRVQRLTDRDGSDLRETHDHPDLARAVVACGPYDRIVHGAGSYRLAIPG